jgi:hypothetical protein
LVIFKAYNELLIYSLLQRWTAIIALTNGKFVGPFKINQLLKYGYEEKLEIKILPPK